MRTLVVGLGLIGGSIAQRLAAVGDLVIGWDSHDETRQRARAAGLDVPTDLPANLSGVDLVVLAVPLRAMPETLGRLADAWTPPGPLLIDVGSVKGPVRRLVRHHGLAHRYVGTHPMAGSENSGFVAARGELLLAAPWAITIDPDTELSDVLAIMHWVMSRHDGRVIPLDDDSHDRAVATVRSTAVQAVPAARAAAVTQHQAAALQRGDAQRRQG